MRVVHVAAFLLGSTYGAALFGASPQVVLVESNTWLMVVGSDSPTFAMYEDGIAIYRSSQPSPSGYVSAKLTAEESRALLLKITPVATEHLNNSYTLTEATDQPTNKLQVWNQGRRTVVVVYGNLREALGARAKAPPSLVAALDAISSFSVLAQRPWLPEHIEVLLWPYEYSPEVPVAWPPEWPPISKAKARGTNGLVQLLLPGTELQNLQKFIGNLRPKQAVSFGSSKWAISYRIPLPEEEKWSH